MSKEKLLTITPRQFEAIGSGSTDDFIKNMISVLAGLMDCPIESVQGAYKTDDGARLFIIKTKVMSCG